MPIKKSLLYISFYILCFYITSIYPLFSLENQLHFSKYIELMENSKQLEISKTFYLNQHRISNWQTAYVIARHFLLFDENPKTALGILEQTHFQDTAIPLLNLTAFVHKKNKNHELAISFFKEAYIKSKYKDPIPLINHVLLLYQLGRIEEGKKVILRHGANLQNVRTIHLLNFIYYFLKQDWTSSEMELNKSILLEYSLSDKAQYYYFLGLLREFKKNIPLAKSYYSYAYHLVPENSLYKTKIDYMDWISEKEKRMIGKEKFTETNFIQNKRNNYLSQRQITAQLKTIHAYLGENKNKRAWEIATDLLKMNSYLYQSEIFYYLSRICFNEKLYDLAMTYANKINTSFNHDRVSKDEFKQFKRNLDQVIENETLKKNQYDQFHFSKSIEYQVLHQADHFSMHYRLPLPENIITEFVCDALLDPELNIASQVPIAHIPINPMHQTNTFQLKKKYHYANKNLLSVIKYNYKEGKLITELKENSKGETLQMIQHQYNNKEQLFYTAEYNSQNQLIVEFYYEFPSPTFTIKKVKVNNKIIEIIETRDNETITHNPSYKWKRKAMTQSTNGNLTTTHFLENKPFYKEEKIYSSNQLMRTKTYDQNNALLRSVSYRYQGKLLLEEIHFSPSHEIIESFVYDWFPGI